MTTKSEFVLQFGPEAEEPEVVSTLESLTNLHALSIEDLYIKWEQYSYQKHETHTNLNQKNLDQFKQFLQHQVEKKAAQVSRGSKSNPSSSTKKPKAMRPLNSSPSLFGFNIPKTPTIKKRKLNGSAGNSDMKSNLKLEFTPGSMANVDNMDPETILEKENVSSGRTPSEANAMTPTPLKNLGIAGKVLDSLNPENLEVASGIDINNEKKIKITPFYDPQKYKFRTMRQSLLDVADVLDEQIVMFTQIIQDYYKLSSTDFGDPTIQSQSNIYAVGRIVPDSPSSEDFLNMESLALETSRMAGIGRRIRLNLSDIAEASLFCGQIVALKGKNANGDYFSVNEVLLLPYPDSPVSTSDEIQEHQLSLDNESLKIVITSGPYLPDNSFNMDNLEEFVNRINSEIKPHTLVMFGPFIDVTHPMIVAGTIPHFSNLKTQPQTLDEVFTKVMAPILKNIHSHIQVLLIPSTRDVLSKHAAYPQDSLDRKTLQLPKNFKCFTNPATFQINEVFFGCSNVDTFKDMKELTKGGNTSMRNRFDRVSEHVLQQRRFYPVFPAGIQKKLLPSSNNEKKVYEHISGADLEVSYLGLTEFVGNFTPDVVVIPSQLQYFARVVQNVIMINPGRFVRPTGGRGTHAQVTILCPNLEDGKLTKMEGEEPIYLHNVWKRARVDLVTN